MFVRNKTAFRVGLARGQVCEGGSAGALVVSSAYRTAAGQLIPCEDPPRLSADPPDLAAHALWSGTSVTAAGAVFGPASPPFLRTVSLTVGTFVRRLIVFGDRCWRPGLAGELMASAPAPFESIPLAFSRAYGGYADVPAGLFPGTDLPFPGGRIAYSPNEGGVGFYLDEAAATGRPLPNLELSDQLIARWSDRPTPGCFAACPELPAMRLTPQPGDSDAFALMYALRALHHAPGYLVFDEVAPGTPIVVEGLEATTVRFEAPSGPVRVCLRRGSWRQDLAPELRSVHVDAARGLVLCVHGYGFAYRESEAPSWIVVES